MNGFAERLTRAEDAECALVEYLLSRGWDAFRWGQGLLEPKVRDRLRQVLPKTYIRWLPDIGAFRFHQQMISLVFFESKTVGPKYWPDGPNVTVEDDCIEANRRFVEAYGHDVIYAFPDAKREWLGASHKIGLPPGWSGPDFCAGSGTPYHIYQRSDLQSLDDVCLSVLERELANRSPALTPVSGVELDISGLPAGTCRQGQEQHFWEEF